MFNQFPFIVSNPMYGATPMMQGLSNMTAPSMLSGSTGKTASFLGKLNWSSLLSNAQKTLNVVNQAIPLYYQVKPVFNNIKTLGRIGKEFTKINNANNTLHNNVINGENSISTQMNNDTSLTSNVPEPTFFL